MIIRIVPVLVALAILTPVAAVHADDQPPPAHVVKVPNRTQYTGTLLTSIGGSMVLGSPLVVLVGAGIVAAGGPYNYAGLGPVLIGAFVSAFIGLGMLVPGIVMLATCRTHKEKPVPMPETKQPAWADARPMVSGFRAVTIPILSGRF